MINASTAFTLTEMIGWTIANNFAIGKRAVLFVCSLSMAVVYSLRDIAIYVRKFILLLLGLFIKPFRVIPWL
ncbi:MAG: hypothetical protein IJP54_00595 [Synergistaceae bacterium]|nr:hypothetical protein [Synergistaceae bacterium]